MVERLAGVESDVVYFESAEEWMLRPEAFWSLHERYRAHPAAERLAWAAAQAPEFGEGCEGDTECVIENLPTDSFLRYLGFYPSGAHAREALARFDDVLEPLTAKENWTPKIACLENVRKGLQAALHILQPVQDAKATAIREKINQALGTTCPPAKTQIQPPAKTAAE